MPVLMKALTRVGGPDFVIKRLPQLSSSEEFDQFHSEICAKLEKVLCENCVNATYGRAARFLAV